MKSIIKRLPIVGLLVHYIHKKYFSTDPAFTDSADYWERRYKRGGDSGIGSYGHLAEFKAEFLNAFVDRNNVHSVIEYGCGDGNQLRLSNYPQYIGFDVSHNAINRCRTLYVDDSTKSFRHVNEYAGETAPLTLSLDVLYHLVEDSIFDSYMHRLFDSSTRFVIIYSSNVDSDPATNSKHVRHREFSSWVAQNKPNWQLVNCTTNKYKFSETVKVGSVSDFFVYEKKS